MDENGKRGFPGELEVTDKENKDIGKKRIGLVIAIIAIVGVMVVAFYMLCFKPLWLEPGALSVGDYVEYKVEGFAIIPVSGTMRIEVVDITSKDYTVSITPSGIPGMKPSTETYALDQPFGLRIEKDWEYTGEETISTAIGTRKVIHYHFENVTREFDFYIDKTTNIALLMIIDGVEIAISETNIE